MTDGESYWWQALGIIAIIVAVGFLIMLGVVIFHDFQRAAHCTDLGGIYHRGVCIDSDKLVKV